MLLEGPLLDAFADEIAQRVVSRLSPPQANERKRLMTVTEAAEYLGKSKQAVYHLVNKDKIPVRRIGTRLMFDCIELGHWLESLPRYDD